MRTIEFWVWTRSWTRRPFPDPTIGYVAVLLIVTAFLAPPLRVGEKVWKQFMRQGIQAQKGGDYHASLDAYWTALKEAGAFGPDHPNVATSLNNLAVLYRVQGCHADAELHYRRCLAIYESLGRKSR